MSGDRDDRAGDQPDVSEADVYERAVSLLARREHSSWELRYKLDQRQFPSHYIDAVVRRLKQEKYLSDTRFAEVFARSRVERGWGPLKIRAALGDRRVAGELVEQALSGLEVEWSSMALEVYRRKFGGKPVRDYRDRSRRLAFLQRRGFEARHSFGALEMAESGDDSEA